MAVEKHLSSFFQIVIYIGSQSLPVAAGTMKATAKGLLSLGDTQACSFLSVHQQTIRCATLLSFSGFSSKEQPEIYLSTVLRISSAQVARSTLFSRESFKSFPSLSHEEIVTPYLLAKQLL